MTKDEELEQLRIEKSALWAIVQRKDAELEQAHKANQDLREGLKQAILAIEYLQERVKTLEGQVLSTWRKNRRACFEEKGKEQERNGGLEGMEWC